MQFVFERTEISAFFQAGKKSSEVFLKLKCIITKQNMYNLFERGYFVLKNYIWFIDIEINIIVIIKIFLNSFEQISEMDKYFVFHLL